ncbi:hypothetical protein U1Q18_038867 [Sarracenia purpurea var. burkii]
MSTSRAPKIIIICSSAENHLKFKDLQRGRKNNKSSAYDAGDRRYRRGHGAGVRRRREGVPRRRQSNIRSPNQVSIVESSGCAPSIVAIPVPPSSLDLNLAFLSGNNRFSGFLSTAHPLFFLNVRIKRSKINATDQRTLRPPIRKRRNQPLKELALADQGVQKPTARGPQPVAR